MKKTNIVKENKDFNMIINNKKSVKNKNFIIYYKENINNKNYRFGISVGKKIGNAVIRNKYKRKLRNIIDNNKKLYAKKLDYIIIVRKNCLDLSFEEIEKSFILLIKKIRNEDKYEEN